MTELKLKRCSGHRHKVFESRKRQPSPSFPKKKKKGKRKERKKKIKLLVSSHCVSHYKKCDDGLYRRFCVMPASKQPMTFLPLTVIEYAPLCEGSEVGLVPCHVNLETLNVKFVTAGNVVKCEIRSGAQVAEFKVLALRSLFMRCDVREKTVRYPDDADAALLVAPSLVVPRDLGADDGDAREK